MCRYGLLALDVDLVPRPVPQPSRTCHSSFFVCSSFSSYRTVNKRVKCRQFTLKRVWKFFFWRFLFETLQYLPEKKVNCVRKWKIWDTAIVDFIKVLFLQRAPFELYSNNKCLQFIERILWFKIVCAQFSLFNYFFVYSFISFYFFDFYMWCNKNIVRW